MTKLQGEIPLALLRGRNDKLGDAEKIRASETGKQKHDRRAEWE